MPDSFVIRRYALLIPRQLVSRLDNGNDVMEQPSSAALALVKPISPGDLSTNLSDSLDMLNFKSSVAFNLSARLKVYLISFHK